MPRHEFFCNDCKRLFSRILSLVDYTAGEVLAHAAGRTPDNGICGRCTDSGQLTRSVVRRRLVASKKASGRRAICATFLSPSSPNRKERIPCIREPLN